MTLHKPRLNTICDKFQESFAKISILENQNEQLVGEKAYTVYALRRSHKRQVHHAEITQTDD